MTFQELERAVRKLRPQEDDTGDRVFRVYCRCGTLLGRTKASRKSGRGKDVGPNILSGIPRQLAIGRPLWQEISGCRAGRSEYLAAFAEHARHE